MRGRMTKGELIERYLAQEPGRFLVLDAVCVGPEYGAGDVTGCQLETGWQWELGGGQPVSVQIAEGTPRADAVGILRQMADRLEQERGQFGEAASEILRADDSGRLSPREHEQLRALLEITLGQDAAGIICQGEEPF